MESNFGTPVFSRALALPSVLESEFYEACKAHDLTFVYADDTRALRKGRAELAVIYRLAALLPRATAVAIWNRAVDEKLLPDVREAFHWQV